MTVYVLKKFAETDEMHLFEATMTNQTQCKPSSQSVCKKMEASDKSIIIFACKDENDTRVKCAAKGRQVCGVCVSHLYATY